MRLLPIVLLTVACSMPFQKSGPAYLGVLYQHTRQGVEIIQVLPDSPARQIGLAIGDTILAVNGESVTREYTLARRIQAERPGSRVRLTVRRASGIEEELVAEIDSAPAQP